MAPRKSKYSASRVSAFGSCTLKYDLQYNRGYYSEDAVQPVLTRKGNAFHEFAEFCHAPIEALEGVTDPEIIAEIEKDGPCWNTEEIKKYKEELEEKWRLPAEFELAQPVQRYYEMYMEVILPVIKAGGKYHREIQFDFELNGSRFTGKLDILLEEADGTFWILDHKTGKSTTTSYYKKQLILYAWALHLQDNYQIPRDEMIKKIKASVFFPFALPEETEMKKIFKSIRVTEKVLEEVSDHFKRAIHMIEGNWEPEAGISRMCEFCGFCGRQEYCPETYRAGIPPTRGVVIKQRQWAIDKGLK